MIWLNANVNIEQVKQYNASLKQYQDKASQVKAGIDFNKKELDRLCKELTTELGVEVTPENVMQVRQEHIDKINNMLKVGNEILGRIRSEEEAASNVTSNITAQQAVPTTPVAPTTPVTPVAPVTPVTGAVPPAPPAAPNVQTPNNIFSDLSGIPPIFSQI